MPTLPLPFSRWPLRYHAGLAASMVLAAALGLGALAKQAQQRLHARQAEQQGLQTQLDAAQRATPADSSAHDFTAALPARTRGDDVVRDAGRQAQSLGVAISSLTVSQQAASARELGRVSFGISAVGDYRSSKAWLGELLGRYPSLAVQTLSLRAASADAARQEMQVTLVLYVKD